MASDDDQSLASVDSVHSAAAGPEEPYALVETDDAIPKNSAITEKETIGQCLYWIGFRTEVERTSIMVNAFTSYRDIEVLSEEDVDTLAKDFSGRTAAGGRINFGLKRTKYLKGLVHYMQDTSRISLKFTIKRVKS